MSEKCFKYPPNFVQHWIDPGRSNLYDEEEAKDLHKRPPIIYLVFLSIGLIVVIIQGWMIIPRLRELTQAGIQFKQSKGEISFPASIRSVIVVLTVPLVSSICYLAPIICPIWYFQFSFFLSLYQCLGLYLFSRMITTYNGDVGSLKVIHHELAVVRKLKTHHFTAPPLCCCCKCCDSTMPCYKVCNGCTPCVSVANRIVTISDLSWIDFGVLQFVVLVPILGFVSFLGEVRGFASYIALNQVVTIISTMSCMTSLNSLAYLITTLSELTVSESMSDLGKDDGSPGTEGIKANKNGTDLMVESETESGAEKAALKPRSGVELGATPTAAERFQVMVQVLMFGRLAAMIVGLIGVEREGGLRGRAYTKTVMTQAWSSFISLVLITLPAYKIAPLYTVKEVVANAELIYSKLNQ